MPPPARRRTPGPCRPSSARNAARSRACSDRSRPGHHPTGRLLPTEGPDLHRLIRILLVAVGLYAMVAGSARAQIFHPTQFTLRSEEHTSELPSLMRISYAVFCLKKKKTIDNKNRPELKEKLHKTH